MIDYIIIMFVKRIYFLTIQFLSGQATVRQDKSADWGPQRIVDR